MVCDLGKAGFWIFAILVKKQKKIQMTHINLAMKSRKQNKMFSPGESFQII